ncbi:protein-export chaperone SecB [Chitinasiproducens palmae]|uniref:Protein-export protein SecB n=1 Tax=Chitinasiproducens palmae TaxID=1770053 RepID=A0A1H2PPM8_9BURK|nr:protein-export chaperone SecB [Chitinasiproducens palmae]SDV48249.1 protein translocase subunit secB [Chitinasiproducens palmae]
MSDASANAAGEQQPVFNIQRVYLKDASFEQPNSPAIFLEQEMPSVEVEVKVQAERLNDTIYESVVTATVTAKIKDKVAFLVEVSQAGIFDIQHIPVEQFEPLIGIACPSIIFPYLRANVADLITRSGFPPIHLAEMNFQAIYEQQLAMHAAQQAQQGGDSDILVADSASIKPH